MKIDTDVKIGIALIFGLLIGVLVTKRSSIVNYIQKRNVCKGGPEYWCSDKKLFDKCVTNTGYSGGMDEFCGSLGLGNYKSSRVDKNVNKNNNEYNNVNNNVNNICSLGPKYWCTDENIFRQCADQVGLDGADMTDFCSSHFHSSQNMKEFLKNHRYSDGESDIDSSYNPNKHTGEDTVYASHQQQKEENSDYGAFIL